MAMAVFLASEWAAEEMLLNVGFEDVAIQDGFVHKVFRLNDKSPAIIVRVEFWNDTIGTLHWKQ
jgi:hypothetical protein